MNYAGDFLANATVRIPWNTNSAAGASITRATDGTLRVYKNGSTTERTSSSGLTDTEDHDSHAGTHLASIDTSDDADAGFYAAGNDYFVKFTAMTIDGQTVNAWVGWFSIQNRTKITITPVQANSSNPRYSTRAMANIGQGSAPSDLWEFDDANDEPIDLSGKTVRLVFAQVSDEGDDEISVVDDTLEGSFKYETGGSGLTIGGADDNQVTLQHDATKTATAGDYRFFWWNVTDKILLAKGSVSIEPTAFDV
jgi:hypothetical protein